jgi:hypothetical protein
VYWQSSQELQVLMASLAAVALKQVEVVEKAPFSRALGYFE